MARIHQFVSALAAGDGVSGGALKIQRILLLEGHTSELFCEHNPDGLAAASYGDLDQANCDLLLVHHSMGHDLEQWIARVECPRALVYHNITPAEFFSANSPEYIYARKGRQQLARWTDWFASAIADSAFNAKELATLGYEDISVIPLVAGHDRLTGTNAVQPSLHARLSATPFILAVGRIAENKCQHLLVEALWHLRQMVAPEQVPKLVLVGGITSLAYQHRLQARVAELGLCDDVLFAGKCTDAELSWYYQNASVLWHASKHEGFCIPLVEACAFGLPVVALGSSTVPDTLGGGGLILERPEAEHFAAVTDALLDDAGLRTAILDAARTNLARFELDVLQDSLNLWLANTLDALTGVAATR